MSYYQGLQAETVDVSRPQWRHRRGLLRAAARAPENFPASSSSIICRMGRMDHRGGAQIRPSRLCGDLAASLFPREARQLPTISARGSARRAASPTPRSWATAGAMAFLRAQPNANGKVGVIGFCSGGRHTYLTACTLPGVDAVVDCWGGNVIVDNPKDLNAKRPVAPIDLTEKMTLPAARHLRQRRPQSDRRSGQPHRGGAQAARQELRVSPL